MIRSVGSEPQISNIEQPEIEHLELESSTETRRESPEYERTLPSDAREARKAELNLSGQAQQAALQRQLAEGRADAIFKACDGIGTNEEAIYKNLSGLNSEQKKQLDGIYREKYGMGLEDQLRNEMSGPELEKALGMLHGKAPSMENRADAIRKACEGLGTDESAIYKNLSGLSVGQKEELESIYQQKYGMSLEQQLRNELSGPELNKALNLLKNSDVPEHLKSSPNSDGPSNVKGETPVSSKNIGRGAKGPNVAELQNQLNEWRVRNGEQPLKADGIFGPKTEAALKEFQKAHGLDADGIAGPKTKAALQTDVIGG